jgi:hypothetical protein
LSFGSYPAIEALAYVVAGLRQHAERTLRDRQTPAPQIDRRDLFKRNRFYKHQRRY